MAPLIRAHDWSKTSLGPIDTWPQSLKTVLGVGLNSRFPVCIYWGNDFTLLYNDAWSVIPGDKHPGVLGLPAHEAWSEVWPALSPQLNGVMRDGIAVQVEDGLMPLQRSGYTEECYFSYNVSPIFGFDGRPVGLFNTVTETTQQFIEARRGELFGGVREAIAQANSAEDACVQACEILAQAPADVPFHAIYLTAPDSGDAYLQASHGVTMGSALVPLQLSQHDKTSLWPLAQAVRTREQVECRLDDTTALILPPWPEPVHTACVLPLFGDTDLAPVLGFLVCGISPRRQLDTPYRRFLDNLASTIARGIQQVINQGEEARQTTEMARRIELRTRERDRIWSLSLDMLCVLDITGVLISVNPAWSEILGWSEEELLGKTTHWLEHPDDFAKTDQIRQSLAEGHRVWRFENRLRHRDGTYRWLSWSATPEKNLLYAAGRDITEEKRTADALARTEEALRNAQRMEVVGQLTGGIAHDFNNLLSGIQVSLDLIQRRLPEPSRSEVERFIQAAAESAQRGAAMTHNLLSFARRQALDMQPLQLDPLILELQDQVHELAGHNVHVKFILEAGRASTISDAEQLRKVLRHLIDNARDAMPHGGQLHITTRAITAADGSTDLPNGNYVLLQVSDSGCGIPASVLAHAFEPFFTTKPLGQGSGLGLSMVYGFLKQIGGQIRLHSEEGQGTSVNLYFPQRGEIEAKQEEEVPVAKELPINVHKDCVLVVEDAEVVRMLTVEVLEEFGYEVRQAADATEALDILNSDAVIDLLMTDVGLPGMNGQQLATEARRLRPDLRVLFATGYAEIVNIDGSDLATHMDVIAKPFSLDDLRNKVSSMLGARTG